MTEVPDLYSPPTESTSPPSLAFTVKLNKVTASATGVTSETSSDPQPNNEMTNIKARIFFHSIQFSIVYKLTNFVLIKGYISNIN